ncbi:hypothetical protein [Dactylosporangium sp. NPDC051541]|uniref:hypothetical protein n=1 Tax=Dactylosporangium sp. NPDC051541 TaxID=3363977 RepID=UPI003795D71A
MKHSVLVMAALLVTLAGCGGGKPDAQATEGVDHDKLVQAAQCMRSHGYPDFPDPVQDQNVWIIPPPASELTPPPECLELFRGAKGRPPQRQLTADEINQRRKWADCIRKNGIPTLPDPDSDGNVNLPPELDPITAQPNWATAREACKSLEWPNANFDS